MVSASVATWKHRFFHYGWRRLVFLSGYQPSAFSCQLKPTSHTALRRRSAMAAPRRGQPQGLPLQTQRLHVIRRYQYHGWLVFVGATGRSPLQIPSRSTANPQNGPSQSTYRAPGCWVGGFSALFRSALKRHVTSYVRRAQSPAYYTDVIRGKTGSAPSGAVLFGPFSYANKKKDKEIGVRGLMTQRIRR